ncbi:MAG: DUF1858 domain-containing protein [Bacteroidales bacterium]|jgi:hypothetical protein|nr:DUF1858 domain-containing protein [Bacteroidales bacterium]HBG87055.1 hypothetical protein [Marinilabiliaceae bacterium]HBX88154.1 hypothetical protein [Marinilabiliaceae bacterium]
MKITPSTKIAALLEAYPQFGDMLGNISPALKKLNSPLVRKTLAKVTSLEQAASMAGLDVGDLISKLTPLLTGKGEGDSGDLLAKGLEVLKTIKKKK